MLSVLGKVPWDANHLVRVKEGTAGLGQKTWDGVMSRRLCV